MVDSDIERFAVAMLVMYKAFGRPADKDITRICFLTLKHLVIEDSEQCISLAVMNEERFPSPANLKKYVSMIPPKPMERIAYEPFGHQNEKSDKLAADAGKLINNYLSGKLTRENLIEGMQIMDRQYPGLGWSHEAAALVCHFRDTPEGQGSGLAVKL